MAFIDLNRKRKLSKALLEMKFMKRTKDKEDQEQEIEESTTMFSKQITEEMKSGANKTIIERSLARCKGLTDGRLSYQGMNPEIERIMELRMSDGSNALSKEEPSADVTESEMAEYNLHINEAIAKKFMKQNDRQAKRPRFMKPNDDF